MRSLKLLTLLPAAVLACAEQAEPAGPLPIVPEDNVVVESRSSLRSAGTPDVNIVGVTVDPTDNRIYLLDADRGLYSYADGVATLVQDITFLVPEDRPLASKFTDFTALGNNRFAFTAANDGFLLDRDANTFRSHFCYVPGSIIDDMRPTPVVQLTRSVTFDQATNRIYAQPQTFANDLTGQVVLSQIGQFEIEGGEGFGWLPIENVSFLAGGIAMFDNGRMVLGEGSKLYVYEMAHSGFAGSVDLRASGVQAIEAMARVPNTDRVLIVDALTDELIEISGVEHLWR